MPFKNQRIYQVILFFSLLFSNPIFTQDLIERTRLGINEENFRTNAVPNELAKLVQSTSRSSNSEITLFEVGEQTQARYARYVNDGVLLNLQRSALIDFWESKLPAVTLKIPVTETADIELELVKVDLLKDDYILTTSDGRNIARGEQEGVFYRGIIKGNSQSFASVSVTKRGIRILAGDDTGNYVVGEMKGLREHILYNDLKLVESNPFTCGSDALSIPGQGLKNIPRMNHSRSSMNSCVPVYVECDYQTYLDIGGGTNIQAVEDYVMGLLADVAMLYANESIDMSLSEVFVWTTADPERNLTDAGEILEAFGLRIQDNYNGRLAHWISTRDLGGGIAWLDVLCSSYFTFMADFDNDNVDELHHAGPYAVSSGFSPTYSAFPTYSWEVEVFAHEMGHNLGSKHTQACVWNGNNTAIDGCVDTEDTCPRPTPNCPTDKGTVMSYCDLIQNCGILFSNGFGTQPGNLIRNNMNTANCTLTCASTGNCAATETVSGNVSSTTIEASNSITTTGVVNITSSVTFRAGNHILLSPGFSVAANNDFLATIGPCVNPFRNTPDTNLVLARAITSSDASLLSTLNDSEVLLSVYPNPSAQFTNVSYQLNQPAAVNIGIYDINGQQIDQLMDGQEQAAGQYQFQYNTRQLGQGMFYIILNTTDFVTSSKLVIIE